MTIVKTLTMVISAAALAAIGTQGLAQSRVQSFRFENGYGQTVECVEATNGRTVNHTITKFGAGGAIDRQSGVTPAAWQASGCFALFAQKNRPVSQDELRRRLNAQAEEMNRASAIQNCVLRGKSVGECRDIVDGK